VPDIAFDHAVFKQRSRLGGIGQSPAFAFDERHLPGKSVKRVATISEKGVTALEHSPLIRSLNMAHDHPSHFD
jgi:hypothetical protein